MHNSQPQDQTQFTQQPHAMPSPSALPWNLEKMPWTIATTTVSQPGGIMQFHALNEAPPTSIERRMQLHQKRKSEIPVPISTKQFISEEKITAHFNGLHISSDYVQNTFATPGLANPTQTTGKCFTNLSYQDYQVTARELEEKLRNAQRISMCEEAKKLHEEQKKVSFLPEALMHRIEKPCTALVLWQKPPIIEALKHQQQSSPMETPNANRSVLLNCDEEFSDTVADDDAEIDDFDNNNSCSLDFNNTRADGMDEDM